MAKTYKEIEAEANRLFGKGASNEKFEWRKAQQRAAGLDTEAKKRGVIAGAYDRNKKLVSAAATAAGYMFGGPAGAGLARGAVQGFDRPGESGIRFDAKRGAKGAVEGYAAGQVANIGKAGLGKLKGMFSPEAPAATQRVFDPTRGGYVDIGGTSPASAPAAPAAPSAMSKVLGFAKENAPLIQGVTGGVSTVIGSKLEADAANRRYDLDEEMFREEQARRDRLAQLLMPMFQQQVQQYGAQRQG
jgi:hypothetical protein